MRNVLLVLLVFLTLPALAFKSCALSFKLADLEKIDGFIGSKAVTLYELKKAGVSEDFVALPMTVKEQRWA